MTNPDKKIRVLVVDDSRGRFEGILRALAESEFPLVEFKPDHRQLVLLEPDPFPSLPLHLYEPQPLPLINLENLIMNKTTPPPAPAPIEINVHGFTGHEPHGERARLAKSLNLVLVPSKSKTLRTLRKVIPGARFQTVTVKGKRSVQLFGRVVGTNGKSSEQPISNVDIPANGSEAGACQALLCAAFRMYGGEATWDPKFPGRYSVKAIKDHKGVETMLPAELDPDLNLDLDALGKLQAERDAGTLTEVEFQTKAAALVREAEIKTQFPNATLEVKPVAAEPEAKPALSDKPDPECGGCRDIGVCDGRCAPANVEAYRQAMEEGPGPSEQCGQCGAEVIGFHACEGVRGA